MMDLKTHLFMKKHSPDTLELKKDNGTDYALSWRSKGIHNSKLQPLYTKTF